MVSRQSGPEREAARTDPDHDGRGECQTRLQGNFNGINGLECVAARFLSAQGSTRIPLADPSCKPQATIRRQVWPLATGTADVDLGSHADRPRRGVQSYRY